MAYQAVRTPGGRCGATGTSAGVPARAHGCTGSCVSGFGELVLVELSAPTVCVVLGPRGHLVRLGGTAARLPASAVTNLNWWRLVICGAGLVSLYVLLTMAPVVKFALRNFRLYTTTRSVARLKIAIGWTFFGTFVVLFIGVTCAFWLSLKVAGALALHPTNREFEYVC